MDPAPAWADLASASASVSVSEMEWELEWAALAASVRAQQLGA